MRINQGGDDSCEDPLVPIPNTKVKLTNAENIWLETAREDRKLPSTRKRRLRYYSKSFFIILNLFDKLLEKSIIFMEEYL